MAAFFTQAMKLKVLQFAGIHLCGIISGLIQSIQFLYGYVNKKNAFLDIRHSYELFGLS